MGFAVFAAMGCLALGLPAGALAASQPAIESTSVSYVNQHDAGLQAWINPKGLSARGVVYQFQVVANPSEYLSEIACPVREHSGLGGGGCIGTPTPGVLPIGSIPQATEGRQASVKLLAAGMALTPGRTYHFRVLAATAKVTEDTLEWEAPPTYSEDRTFTTPPAGMAPSIESVSISHLTPTDATLEAQINTEDLATTYEFQLWSSPCSKHGVGCELIEEIPLPSGLLLGSIVGQSVSLDLNSAGVTLGGGEYGFSVRATNKEGSTEADGGTFEAPPGVLDPPSPGVSPRFGAGQPLASGNGDQPAGTGGSSSSSAPGVQSAGLQAGKTIKLESLGSAQKLAKALKACKEKSKSRRAVCKRRARAKYGTTASKAKRR